MHIKRIEMQGFMKHTNTVLDLPDTGLVVITGENGSGKSSFMEAIAWCIWGKTLRGTPAEQAPDIECRVRLVTDRCEVTRTRLKKTSKLVWNLPGEEPVKWENNTRAKEALLEIVGPQATWEKTAVFSSADASTFTLATDGERKRLIESLLGLAKFDTALAACRVDFKVAKKASLAAESQLQVASAYVAGERQRIADTTEGLKVHGLPVAADDLKQKLREAKTQLASVLTDLQILEKQKSDATVDARVAQSSANRAEGEKARLSGKECPACGQAITERMVEELTEAVAWAVKAAEEAAEKAKVVNEDTADELAELRELAATLRKLGGVLEAKISTAARSTRQRESLQRLKAAAEAALAKAEEAVAEHESAKTSTSQEMETLKACDTVLGLRGVRAQVIGNALKGVEASTNNWLTKIVGEGMSVTLKPYSEKADGAISDAISLEVIGAGGGYGYKAASQGERRRIDVAFLMALAEMASAAAGHHPGFLAWDEVFDALDGDGRAAVVEVLTEMAATRAVMVVTHSESLAAQLPATLRVSVQDGAIV